MTPKDVYYAFDYDDDKPWLWRGQNRTGKAVAKVTCTGTSLEF